MAVAAPLLCFALLVAALPATPGLRSRLLAAAVSWGVLVTIITEGASAVGQVTPAALGASWACAALLAALAALARRGRPDGPAVATTSAPRSAIAPADVLLLVAVAGVVLGTGLIAGFGWPSQWDSMVYHLPRIDHWLQNRHVAFYPTNVVRQLFNPPWAEYAALQLMATGGDERWGNAVAWASMVGSLIGVSLIAKHLGAGVRGQILAVFVCATIRMGILQAAGTQNDYVTAFWLVCATEAVLAPTTSVAASAWGGLRLGAALGLAMLTKGTAALFAAPMLVALWPWSATPRWPMIRAGVLAVLTVAALNAPHAARNLATFGSPLGPASAGSATGDDTDSLANAGMTPALLASNLIRNLANHAGTGWHRLDGRLTSLIERAHDAVGLDASDPRTSRLYPLPGFVVDGHPADPDRTGSPVHLAAVIGVLALILATRRPLLLRYAVGLVGGFVAFCLVLKWQPWHARLHLPWFVLAAPLVGVATEPWRQRRLVALALLAMGVLAVPPVVLNYLGPLALRANVFTVPRARQYFHWFGQPSEPRLPDYLAGVAALHAMPCTDVGLLIGWDDWEHPWWVLVSEEGRRPVRIRHVAVENPSARLAGREPAFVPCGIVVGRREVGDGLEVDGRLYRLAWAGSDWRLFTIVSSSPRATARWPDGARCQSRW